MAVGTYPIRGIGKHCFVCDGDLWALPVRICGNFLSGFSVDNYSPATPRFQIGRTAARFRYGSRYRVLPGVLLAASIRTMPVLVRTAAE
ncbi:hypothetical protein [Nocardia sp. XZ_19_369]|uniref:hypothetical protein n=1 Tax=Nocardia sp. XZ_19_369 TaxID=2769487 RepID=UPI00188FBE00|nr:hypothetical protein [Nocardia sp. XZ_19_369]